MTQTSKTVRRACTLNLAASLALWLAVSTAPAMMRRAEADITSTRSSMRCATKSPPIAPTSASQDSETPSAWRRMSRST